MMATMGRIPTLVWNVMARKEYPCPKHLQRFRKTISVLGLVICLIASEDAARGQWTPTNSPTPGSVKTIFASGSNLFAGVGSNGIFASGDSGNSWTGIDIPGLNGKSLSFGSFAQRGTILFAGGWGAGLLGSVYRSLDNGASWS